MFDLSGALSSGAPCSSCGSEIPRFATRCPGCGTELDEDDTSFSFVAGASGSSESEEEEDDTPAQAAKDYVDLQRMGSGILDGSVEPREYCIVVCRVQASATTKLKRFQTQLALKKGDPESRPGNEEETIAALGVLLEGLDLMLQYGETLDEKILQQGMANVTAAYTDLGRLGR